MLIEGTNCSVYALDVSDVDGVMLVEIEDPRFWDTVLSFLCHSQGGVEARMMDWSYTVVNDDKVDRREIQDVVAVACSVPEASGEQPDFPGEYGGGYDGTGGVELNMGHFLICTPERARRMVELGYFHALVPKDGKVFHHYEG